MRSTQSRKRVSAVCFEKASPFGWSRWGGWTRWLALAGLIAMQTWLAYSNAAKASSSDVYLWNGSTTDWNTPTNWSLVGSGSVAPVGDLGGASIYCTANATRRELDCSTAVSGIGSLTLSNYTYIISGAGTLGFSNGATINASDATYHALAINLTAAGDLTIANTCRLILGDEKHPDDYVITLQNNGTLTLNAATTVENYDKITGSGSLVKNGTGTFELYHTNDYSGSTTINAGTLGAYVAGALPSTTDVTIASGARLDCTRDQTVATLAGAGSMFLDSNVGFTLAGTGSSTFSGSLHGESGGSEALTKTGIGTLTMTSSATVSYVDVNVNAGTVEFNGTMENKTMTVGSAGTLTGTGTIYTLANNGTLSPGNSSDTYGTMTVSGTYTNGANSTVVVHINATDCSKIAVTSAGAGNVTLSGGTVHVVAASGNTYTVGQHYRFLTTGGTVSGQYGTAVTCDDTTLAFQLLYGTNYVELELTRAGSFNDKASTGNQHAVASYLDRQKTGASGDFATVINELNSLGTADSRAAFDAMGGELFGSLSTIGLENTENFLTGLAQRLRQQSMTRGMAFQTAQAKWDDSLLLVSRHESWLREKAEGWTTWAEGFGVGAKLAGNGNASGLGYSTGGLSLGMEKWLEEDLLVGLAGGYSNTYTLLDERNDRSTIDAGHFAVYFQREFETRYLNGVAGYGYNAYDSLRHVTIGSLERTAEASYAGNSFSFYTEVGQNVRGRYVHLQPYAALEYIQLHQNGFTETGADSVNLSVGGVGADAFRGLLGTRVLSYLRTDAGRLVTLEGRAAWRHEFLDDNRILDATFAGQTGTAYAIQGINVDRDAAILGTGLTYDMTKSLKFGLNYDLLFSANYTAHAGSGNVALAW